MAELEITKQILEQALRRDEYMQYVSLKKLILEGKVLTGSQQAKMDKYQAKIEDYVADSRPVDDMSFYAWPRHRISYFFGVTDDAVQKWLRMESWPKHSLLSHGRYNIKVIFDWYIARFYGNQETAQRAAEAKARREIIRAEKEQMELDELKGQLMRTERLFADITFIVNGMKQRLLAWRQTLPAMLAHRDEREISTILSEQSRFILEEFAGGVKRIFRGLRTKKQVK
jgi:hypothetical protein